MSRDTNVSQRRVAFLFTGGTISCAADEHGRLSPCYTGEEILAKAGLDQGFGTIVVDLWQRDSADLGPDEWSILAQHVISLYDKVDGFVVVHGTDTLPYTAAALTFALSGLGKPVVLTGSMLPPGISGTDAAANLRFAVQAAALPLAGIMVAFHGCLLSGLHVYKVRSEMGKTMRRAFGSSNHPMLGYERTGTVALTDAATQHATGIHTQAPVLRDTFSHRVGIRTVSPFTSPEELEGEYAGLVLVGLGGGGLPRIPSANVAVAAERIALEKPVVLVTSCRHGDVAKGYAHTPHLLSSGGLTVEATTVKLSWVLGQVEQGHLLPEAIPSLFKDGFRNRRA